MRIYGRDIAGAAPATGDFASEDGLTNLKAAIRRRLETPRGALFAHPEYGNRVWDMLGDELDEVWAARAVAVVRDCLAQEPRIQWHEVDCELVPESRLARFYVRYVPIAHQVTENLIWEVGPVG